MPVRLSLLIALLTASGCGEEVEVAPPGTSGPAPVEAIQIDPPPSSPEADSIRSGGSFHPGGVLQPGTSVPPSGTLQPVESRPTP